MANLPRKRRSVRQMVNCDLELRPLMNVFIVLIPMLLMSAVFMEIRVIEMTLPQTAAASIEKPLVERFDLAIRITANAYVVEANGVALQTITRVVTTADQAVPDEAAAAQIAQVLAQIVSTHPGNKEIRIVANASTHYREIVAVMDLARTAGLPEAALEGAQLEGA